MSSKVLEGGLSFWVVAILSISAISSFNVKATGIISDGGAAFGASLLSQMSGLLGGLKAGDSVVVHFPSGLALANLTLDGDTLTVSWGTGTSSVGLSGVGGRFSIPLEGSVEFVNFAGALEASRVG